MNHHKLLLLNMHCFCNCRNYQMMRIRNDTAMLLRITIPTSTAKNINFTRAKSVALRLVDVYIASYLLVRLAIIIGRNMYIKSCGSNLYEDANSKWLCSVVNSKKPL